MYRGSLENKQVADSFSNLLGFNSLDMNCFQEMCLENYASLTGATSSTPRLSPISPTSFSATMGSNYSSNSSAHSTPSKVAHEQHLTAAAVAQHQLAIAAVISNSGKQQANCTKNYNNNINYCQPQNDEISKSLKMFAMLSAYGNGNESCSMPPLVPQSSVDAVMQDFACNGYICDDLNRYQLGMHLSKNPAMAAGLNNSFFNSANNQQQNTISPTILNAASAAAASMNQQQLQQQNLNINFNNFWKMLPTHMQQHSNAVTAAAAAAAAAVNFEYNYNQKRLPKRYNSTKSEKYTSVKHCVFCENNNEAEAVVKSHAVRDSLGRVLCPKLRTYICPICKASGDMAHTVKYCPQKPIITMEDAIKAETFRLTKGTYYKQQMKV